MEVDVRIRFTFMACIIGVGALTGTWAVNLGTYKGCAATDLDFTPTQIFVGPAISNANNSNGVLKMALDGQDGQPADVYFVQKMGAVKRYNGKTRTVDSLGVIRADHSFEMGLVGIVLDPDFKTNRILYLDYTFVETPLSYSVRVSRFKLGSDNKLDMTSEKVLLKIPRTGNKVDEIHSGGAMQFDSYGDLWIAMGDIMTLELGPGNTADLKGGILRIHPDEKAPKGYTIPKGNFGEHFSAKFQAAGNTALARDYADTSKVKAEIYVKGTRNAFTLSLDPVRRWVTWGDVGPDLGASAAEEYNLVKEPFYTGWPYFAGVADMGGIASYGHAGVPAVPSGTSRLTPMNNNPAILGARQLPANHDPIFGKSEACAMSGPIFRYDGSNTSITQFPPQFDRKWLVSDCNGGYGVHIFTLDSLGEKVSAELRIFAQMPIETIVDLKQGPDGSLYFVNWNKGIYRIDYIGSCKDPGLLPEKTGCADPTALNYNPSLPKAFNDQRLCTGGVGILDASGKFSQDVFIQSQALLIEAAGPHQIEVFDLGGRKIKSWQGLGRKSYPLALVGARGFYHLRVKTPHGEMTRRIFWMGL
jgi:glucose/arabinose dehydrogenase